MKREPGVKVHLSLYITRLILKTGEIERGTERGRNGNGTEEERERNGNGSSVERAVRGNFFLTRTVRVDVFSVHC